MRGKKFNSHIWRNISILSSVAIRGRIIIIQYKKRYLLIWKHPTLLYPMPFLNTAPTTGDGDVLGNKNGMPSHRRLFTIAFRILWRYSGFYEIDGVLPDCVDTFILDILPVFEYLFWIPRSKETQSYRHDTPKRGPPWLVPIYLFKRARILKHNLTYLIV